MSFAPGLTIEQMKDKREDKHSEIIETQHKARRSRAADL